MLWIVRFAHDDIERVRVKGQVTGVRVHEFHLVGYPFKDGIALGGGLAVACLVAAPPDVSAHRAPAGNALGGEQLGGPA